MKDPEKIFEAQDAANRSVSLVAYPDGGFQVRTMRLAGEDSTAIHTRLTDMEAITLAHAIIAQVVKP
jgi:hypothetical protein